MNASFSLFLCVVFLFLSSPLCFIYVYASACTSAQQSTAVVQEKQGRGYFLSAFVQTPRPCSPCVKCCLFVCSCPHIQHACLHCNIIDKEAKKQGKTKRKTQWYPDKKTNVFVSKRTRGDIREER